MNHTDAKFQPSWTEIGDIYLLTTLETMVAYADIDPTIFCLENLGAHSAVPPSEARPTCGKPCGWLPLDLGAGIQTWCFLRQEAEEGKPYGVSMDALCCKLLGRIYIILQEDWPYEMPLIYSLAF